MSVEVIAHPTNPAGFRILDVQEILNLGGPVNGGALLADMDLAAAVQRFSEHKNIGRAVALVFVTDVTQSLSCFSIFRG